MPIALCLFISLTVQISSSDAGSFYSSKGLGIWRYYSSGQGAGMGGLGVALTDNLMINQLNPAARYPVQLTRISGDFSLLLTDSETEIGAASTHQFLAAGFRLLVPLGTSLSFSASLSEVTTVNYKVGDSDSLADSAFDREISGEGGLNNLSVALFFSPWKRLYIGAGINFYFGQIRERWEIDFASSDYTDTVNQYSTNLTGAGGTFGVIVKPILRWNIGAVISTKADLSGTTEVSYSFGIVDSTDSIDKALPLRWGIGTTYRVGSWLQIGADYQRQHWSDQRSAFNTSWQYCDSHFFAAGLEATPSVNLNDGYFRRMSYRVGFHQSTLNFKDGEGDAINEWAISLGIGLPFYGNQGRIDVAFEMGVRGNLADNPVEENITRLIVNVVGGERWFVRR